MSNKTHQNPSGISLQNPDNSSAFSNSITEPLFDTEKAQNSPATKIQMGKILYMGFCFLILNTATSCQNLLSQIYEQLGYDSLGTTILLMQSISYVLGILVVSGIIKKWEYKKGINVGAFGYIVILVAGAMTTACGENKNLVWCKEPLYIYGSNIFFALLHGFTSPIIWLCGIRYIAGCASAEQKGQAMGTFVGLFSGFLVLGGIISKLTITRFGSFGYYLISAGCACVVMVMFMIAPKVERAKEEDDEEPVIEKTKKILKLVVGPRMRTLLPYMLYAGFINAMISAFQYKLVQNSDTDGKMTPDDLNRISVTINLVQGIICTLSSVVAGKLADLLKRRTALHVFNVVQALGLIFAFVSYTERSLLLVYLTAVCWGVGIFGANTVMAVVMSNDFKGSIESFAIPQIIIPLAATFGYGLCMIPQIVVIMIVLVAVLVISFVSISFYNASDDCEKK